MERGEEVIVQHDRNTGGTFSNEQMAITNESLGDRTPFEYDQSASNAEEIKRMKRVRESLKMSCPMCGATMEDTYCTNSKCLLYCEV